MDFSEELDVVEKLYTQTAEDLDKMQAKQLESLIVEMKKFIQVHEAKIEQDSRLNNLKWKVAAQKRIDEMEREDSDRELDDDD